MSSETFSIAINGNSNDSNLVVSSTNGAITDGIASGPAGPAGPAGPSGLKVSGFNNKSHLETNLKNMLESKVNKPNGGESTPWAVYTAMCGDDKVSVSVGYDADYTDLSGGVQDTTRPASEDTIMRIYSQTKAITKAAMMCMERDNLLHHTDPIKKHLVDFSGVALKVIRPGKCVDVSGVTVDSAFDKFHSKIKASANNVIDLTNYDISAAIAANGNNGLVVNQNYAMTVGSSRVYFELEDAVRDVTLTHLSTHTSGLNNYNPLWAFTLVNLEGNKVNSNVIQRVLQATTGDSQAWGSPGWPASIIASAAKTGLLTHQPGEQFAYSVDNDMQGELLTRVYRLHKNDSSLDQQDMLNEILFNHLGMIDTFYYRVPGHSRFALNFESYMPAVNFAGAGSNVGWVPRGGGKKRLSEVIASGSPLDSFTTFMDVKGWYLSGGGGLMSTAKEYLIFLRFLMTGLDKNGDVLVPKSLLNRYVREVKQSYGADEFDLGPGYGYGVNWDYYTSSLIARILPDGRVFDEDLDLTPSDLTNNRNSFYDSDTVLWGGAAGTGWVLDFTNDSCHHSVIQRSGGDTAYNRETSAGYRNFIIHEGLRLCQNNMKGEGDYVTNNVAFERSVADELYKLKTTDTNNLKLLQANMSAPGNGYGRPLYCPVKENDGILHGSICVPSKIAKNIADSSQYVSLFKLIKYWLEAPMDTSANRKMVGDLGSSITTFIGNNVGKNSPWKEYALRFGEKVGKDDAVTKKLWDLYALGNGCVCTSTSPVCCIYTPFCNMIGFYYLSVGNVFPHKAFRIDQLFQPWSDISNSLNVRAIYTSNDDTKPAMQFWMSAYKIWSADGKKPLRFHVNKDGMPTRFRPHKDNAKMEYLIDNGYTGITKDEYNAEKSWLNRCTKSDYCYSTSKIPITEVIDTSAMTFTTDEVVNAETVSAKEYFEAFQDSYQYALGMTDLFLLGQYNLDVSASNNNLPEELSQLTASEWDTKVKGDEHLKYAVYELKPHKAFFDNSGNTKSSPPTLADFSNNATKINGSLFHGPNNIREQSVTTNSPSANLPTHQFDDLSYATWTVQLMGALTQVNILTFFIGVQPGEPISVLHYNVLVRYAPSFQTFGVDLLSLVGKSATQPVAANNLTFIKTVTNHDAFLTCCVDGTMTGAQYNGYGKTFIELPCSKPYLNTANRPFKFSGMGNKLINQGEITLNCPKYDVEGDLSHVSLAVVNSDSVDFTYPGTRVPCPAGKFSELISNAGSDTLDPYVADVFEQHVDPNYPNETFANGYYNQYVKLRKFLDARKDIKSLVYDRLMMANCVISQKDLTEKLDITDFNISGSETLSDVITKIQSFNYGTAFAPIVKTE